MQVDLQKGVGRGVTIEQSPSCSVGENPPTRLRVNHVLVDLNHRTTFPRDSDEVLAGFFRVAHSDYRSRVFRLLASTIPIESIIGSSAGRKRLVGQEVMVKESQDRIDYLLSNLHLIRELEQVTRACVYRRDLLEFLSVGSHLPPVWSLRESVPEVVGREQFCREYVG